MLPLRVECSANMDTECASGSVYTVLHYTSCQMDAESKIWALSGTVPQVSPTTSVVHLSYNKNLNCLCNDQLTYCVILLPGTTKGSNCYNNMPAFD